MFGALVAGLLIVLIALFCGLRCLVIDFDFVVGVRFV